MGRRRGLRVNAGKSKVRVMNGEEGLECEVHTDGVCLEHVYELKYLGCVLDEAGTDGAECSRKVANGRRGASAIRSLVDARDLQIECARVLHEALLVPVLTYGSVTMLWKEKERSRIRVVQILGGWIRELYEVMKGVGKRIDEDVLWWFGHVEGMEKDKIAKRIYVGECASSCS